MWYFSKSQSLLIQMNQINVQSQNNVHHIKSPFWYTIQAKFTQAAHSKRLFEERKKEV
jgi:hypothetical protein